MTAVMGAAARISLNPGTAGSGNDAALAMCKVIIDGGLYNKQFFQEQTDLPLLVRKDSDRFLRACDLAEGGREDAFYWQDALTGVVTPAPRGTLATTGIDPALEGSYSATLKDGSQVDLEPVFARLCPNGDQVRLVSDVGDCLVEAKLSASVRPGQVILYNGFEPYMHENWYSQSDLEPGHVKQGALDPGGPRRRSHVVDDREHQARRGHAPRLGADGRGLLREGRRPAGKLSPGEVPGRM